MISINDSASSWHHWCLLAQPLFDVIFLYQLLAGAGDTLLCIA
jgi:hypothetical protein